MWHYHISSKNTTMFIHSARPDPCVLLIKGSVKHVWSKADLTSFSLFLFSCASVVFETVIITPLGICLHTLWSSPACLFPKCTTLSLKATLYECFLGCYSSACGSDHSGTCEACVREWQGWRKTGLSEAWA